MDRERWEYTNYLEQNAASGQAYDYIVFKYNIGKRPIWFKTQLKGKRWGCGAHCDFRAGKMPGQSGAGSHKAVV